MLSDKKFEEYNSNGYFIERLFTEEECDGILKICEKHADEDHKAFFNPERRIPGEEGKAMLDLIRDPRIVTIMEDLHNGKEMCCIGTQIIFKKPNTPFHRTAFYPHQDGSYLETYKGADTVFVLALCDSDVENGCVWIYPGSHVEDILPYAPHPGNVPYQDPGNEVINVPKKYLGTEINLELKKGEAAFFHGHLIHGSHPNISQTRWRPYYLSIYIEVGAPFRPGRVQKREIIRLHD